MSIYRTSALVIAFSGMGGLIGIFFGKLDAPWYSLIAVPIVSIIFYVLIIIALKDEEEIYE